MANRDMKAVSGSMTVRKISRERLSGFFTLLVTNVVAYLKMKEITILITTIPIIHYKFQYYQLNF